MRAVIVIPARYGSSRFPGKPLTLVRGKTLIERVWKIAQSTGERPATGEGIEVIVATDDERIRKHVEDFGGRVVMTSELCRNGSERVFEAVSALRDAPDIVVNLQGDAPLIPPTVIAALIQALREDNTVQIATPAVQLSKESYRRMAESKGAGVVSGTTVTFSKSGDALYFSKAIIPFIRTEGSQEGMSTPVYQHIGIYAYRCSALSQFVKLPEGQFEKVEQLEQLRALENGMPIRVVQVSLDGRTLWPVDTPHDVGRVEEILEREGELP